VNVTQRLRLATLALLGLVIASSALSGCAAVKPWERDVLARSDMAWDPDPQQAALRNHIHFSKEASMPGSGGGGGGCGCN
jgi:hypothetical protein